MESIFKDLDDILEKAVVGGVHETDKLGDIGYVTYLHEEGYLVRADKENRLRGKYMISAKGVMAVENGGLLNDYRQKLELERTRERLDSLSERVSTSTIDTNISVGKMNRFSRVIALLSLFVAICSVAVAYLSSKSSDAVSATQLERLIKVESTLDSLEIEFVKSQNSTHVADSLKRKIDFLSVRIDSVLENINH